MQKNSRKRIIALLLSLIIISSSVPNFISAASESETQNEASSSAYDNSTGGIEPESNQTNVITDEETENAIHNEVFESSDDAEYEEERPRAVSGVTNGIYAIESSGNHWRMMIYDIQAFHEPVPFQYPASSTSLFQMFRITDASGGYYYIQLYANPDKYLSYVNSSSVQFATTGSINKKKWSIEQISTYYYVFRPKSNPNVCLTFSSNVNTQYANMKLEAYSGLSTQKLLLYSISSPPSGIIWKRDGSNSLLAPTAANTSYVGATHKFYASYYNPNVTGQSFTWGTESGNSNIIAVTSSGDVQLVGAGTDKLTLSHSSLSTPYKYTFDTALLQDGTYFIKNKGTEKYVDIDSDGMSSGTLIEQWDFTGEAPQKWIFQYLGDQYYTIKSANSMSSYYLGVQNDGTATDTPVVLRTGSITDGMKWKIEVTTSGAYKITPKTGEDNDRVLAVGWYALNVNGIDIKQRDYVEDGNYKDEWNLCMITPDFTNMYIGASDGDMAMPGILLTVKNQFNSNGYSGNSLDSSTKNELIYMLKESNVFSAITHGNQTSIRLTGDVYFSVSDVNSFGSVDLNRLVFVYLGACETGKGGELATNLVNSFFSKGVDNVVGFTISVLVDETNFWTTEFMSNIAKGQSIGTAISNADNSIQSDPILGGRSSYTISSRLIRGSTSTIPCP